MTERKPCTQLTVGPIAQCIECKAASNNSQLAEFHHMHLHCAAIIRLCTTV